MFRLSVYRHHVVLGADRGHTVSYALYQSIIFGAASLPYGLVATTTHVRPAASLSLSLSLFSLSHTHTLSVYRLLATFW